MKRLALSLIVACAIVDTTASAADLPPLPPPDPQAQAQTPAQTQTQTQAPTQTQTQAPTQTQTQTPTPTQTQLPSRTETMAPPLMPPPEVPPPAPPTDPNRRMRGFLYGKAGYALGRIYDISESQGNFHIGGGAHTNRLAFYGYFDLLYGSTSAGLRVYDGSLGAGADGRINRFRIGGGMFIGSIWIRRTTFDDNVHAYSTGMFAHASADIYNFGFRDDHAVFVDFTARGEVFIGGTTGQLALTAGFRY
jgi:hypothetical protein